MLVMLPHLVPDPEALYDELEDWVPGLDARPVGEQYRRLFAWLSDRFDRWVWVERSGASLLMAVFLTGLEIFVALLQAYVFTILTAVYIERGYAVIAGRQIGQDKFRAILRLTRLPKYSAQKFSACERFRAFSRQQKGWPNRCFCAGESGLVLFDRGFDSVKAGGHGGNGVLLQGSCIPARRHFEIAFRRGFERGSYGGIHVRGGLAGLGVGRTSQQTSEQSSEQCSQQQEPQPLSAVPSIPEREFRPNNRSNAQRESLRWHFTRS